MAGEAGAREAVKEGDAAMNLESDFREISRRLCLIEAWAPPGALTPEELAELARALLIAQRVCDRLVAIRTNRRAA
jgi:alkylhydroperoxidase/carboxymuconolactone decarboxylase family protein YurZ